MLAEFFCKVYPFNHPSKLFLCVPNFTTCGISQHDHTWGDCCVCQKPKPTLCLQVLNMPGGVFPVPPTGILDNVMRDLFPISDAHILCTPCPSGLGRIPIPVTVQLILSYPSWDTYFYTLKYKFLYSFKTWCPLYLAQKFHYPHE